MPDNPNLPQPTPGDGQVLIYQDGATRLQVRLQGQTIWLSQRLIAELFQVSVPTVNEHLSNIYSEGELNQRTTLRNFRIVQTEGPREVSRAIDHYSLDAILAVGYRVRSARGTAFRQWATSRLSELLVKGFTMDDERLKEGRTTPGQSDDLRHCPKKLHFAIRGGTAVEVRRDSKSTSSGACAGASFPESS